MASELEGVHVFVDPSVNTRYRLGGTELGAITGDVAMDFRGIPLQFWHWRPRRDLPDLPPGIPPVVEVHSSDISAELESIVAPFAESDDLFLVVDGVDFDLADVIDAHYRLNTRIWVMSPQIADDTLPPR